MTLIHSMLWFCSGLIAYTYAGYPLLLWLLAKLTRRQAETSQPAPTAGTDELPTVTLLIAAYNEETSLAAKLANSLQLAYPPDRLQILVAADGSDDGTVAIAARYAAQGVELSYSPHRHGKVAAINRAMGQARGAIIVFSDANNLYAKETIRALVAPFADARVGAVAGAKVIVRGDGALGESEGLYWKYEAFIKQQESRLGNCVGVAGEVFALRRQLFRPIPDGLINDDAYLALDLLRRGQQIRYAPAARSYERVSLSAADEVTRRTRIVTGRYQALADARRVLPWHRPFVLWQIISHKFLRLVVPFAMIGALLSNLLLVYGRVPSKGRDKRRGARLLLTLQLLFYLAAGIGNTVALSGKLGKTFYLPTFLVNSNWATLLGLFRFLSGHQSTQWQRVQRREVAIAAE
jgi:cellulose synthase/poly-beta-1,6-N-acetylglucosamine synthase-like glycosyltransferase